jgi:hypothetical protein
MNNQIQPQEQQHIAYANPDSISCEGLYINFLPFSIELGPSAYAVRGENDRIRD